jgi:hypothetical protein
MQSANDESYSNPYRMAQRKPNRKKRISRLKPGKFHPLNRFVRKRVVRRAVERQKKKKGEKEWKDILFIILRILTAIVVLGFLIHLTRMHEQQEHQSEKK